MLPHSTLLLPYRLRVCLRQIRLLPARYWLCVCLTNVLLLLLLLICRLLCPLCDYGLCIRLRHAGLLLLLPSFWLVLLCTDGLCIRLWHAGLLLLLLSFWLVLLYTDGLCIRLRNIALLRLLRDRMSIRAWDLRFPLRHDLHAFLACTALLYSGCSCCGRSFVRPWPS